MHPYIVLETLLLEILRINAPYCFLYMNLNEVVNYKK